MTLPLTPSERGRMGGLAGGKKGGSATGKRKARPREHYQIMAAKSAAVRRAKKEPK